MATPSVLQVTPSVAFTEYRELNFQGLYLYHTYSGSKANQARIINNAPIGIGATDVNNWEVYDGPGPEAKLVARAQGLHIHAKNWVCSFSLVFVDKRFSGSTLEVMGIVVEKGEWAIVGGTGQFAMANGVISKKLHESTSGRDIIELTIRAFCPVLKAGTRYPVTKIGLWGGSPVSNGLGPHSSTPASGKHHHFYWSRRELHCILLRRLCWPKALSWSLGGSGGNPETIQLAESEVLTEVSGTIGIVDGVTVITSIKFVTNLNKTYGPFGAWGDARDTSFAVPMQAGGGIVGFFARAGVYLNAIGVYV